MGLVFIYLSFKQKLVELKKKNKHLINVNRCPMHVTSNCFLKRVKVWTAEADNAFDQIVIDLFGFSGICKTCSRLLQCRKLCWFTSSTNSKTRFSKLDKPSEYFFTTVLDKKFLGVRLLRGGSSEKYISMKEPLQNKKLPAITSSVIYAAKERNSMIIALY